ncbi:hypothetical protein ABT187_04540 [Streptomyces sp. NPDC001817]|uniref:hypothetical protein n=1 Tax=Streptomyces sp. NPDC001817 TaxID=3154398 RepID=UPI00332920A8
MQTQRQPTATTCGAPTSFSRCRRKLLHRWRGAGPESEPGWLPATALGGVWLGQEDPNGGAVVTLQFLDGAVVAYTARPDQSRQLRDGFEALLPTHHPVPTAMPHHPGPPRS